jgi:phage-related protein
MTPKTRPVSWLRSALKEFEAFPEGARSICLAALTIAAEGGKADIAKPMHGLGSGVFEIALPFKSDAFRVVYAVQLAADIWVVHAFQKKSTQSVKTPKHEIDLMKDRLKRLKEMLR